MLAGDGTVYREHLLSLGLIMAPGRFARDSLHEYISTARPSAKARCVDRTGWHDGVFVLPDVTIGPQPTERVLLQLETVPDHAFFVRGTLESWQKNVAAYAVGNSRLVMALSTAFAAPLVELTGQESAGFHVRGRSSTGKSSALEAAGSVWGGGGKRKKYIESWRATDNGLETVAVTHSDTLLCLDEISQVDAKAAGAVAYMLANGGGGRPAATWQLLWLSSGEISLADKLAEDGTAKKITAGQQVRVIDIPADAQAGMGLFEQLHGFASAAKFSDHLKAASQEHYGVAARVFLARVAEDLTLNDPQILPAVRGHIDDFQKRHCPDGADGQVSRVVTKFAMVAAAGELAIALKILPWEPGEAAAGVEKCLRAWLDCRGGTEPVEIIDGVRQVLTFLQLHGAGRFEPWGDGLDGTDPWAKHVDRRLGWRKLSDRKQWEYYVTPGGWREMTTGYDAAEIARAMIERKMLVPDAGGKSAKSVKPPGYAKQRLYHIPAEALSEAAEADVEVSDDGA